mmetsp:Transcript_49101/g.72954  ORF Transcript_49101/g.72954 Transcript_49101/m.72954 type:complete len:237 (+) Transcript_49101:35-745(+)
MIGVSKKKFKQAWMVSRQVLVVMVISLQAVSAFNSSSGVNNPDAWQVMLSSTNSGQKRTNNFVNKRSLRSSSRIFASKEDEDHDDSYGDDDDDVEIKPYGNRSLAWTKRYRRLNPYEKVRKRVIQFGHRSKEDWDECIASGQQGAYVPTRPDEMYAPEWVSWDEFLGLMRSFEETRHIAVNVLGLRSFDSYILFVRGDPKRAEGLRIPVRPDLFYKGEWIDEEHFFSFEKDTSSLS